jgi:hypothetical protein
LPLGKEIIRKMPFNPTALLNYPIPPMEETITEKQAILYAASLGVGADPLDARRFFRLCPWCWARCPAG